ncbi:hypothetical protein CPAST_c29630 [Clostridium pasteurianum DSM 525 = ATCC 6013]|uniref:Uncharacterized protein n=1 Tax=Clostridium pasteurianum DSM 525 = ATCC 6013 TaxID=1262449 RepID=A0A0H3J6F1_CLOPA|nr:hypothetical protein [Clostridium pasteurianum]AJA49029.1 hypothetical protein CPAST_c29630 [Clostridium pasteurianum DSM 525 = ATCC 6013]AJA53017.1 hypothetical protein CLPA_c29630 [Clostridium pasteurianum DSM 525 = ATCC 6013]AOZ76234.1 hypothetical protein AQ983_14410 [Clostridium pasteurianum DSM 525 = ATCC 6013]AOZ80030.1 hypothetical protein AQ984_14405 [Clostridium pasteurianum]ELP60325.1 hypothetical protein F502_06797 [Clostridium pasteurianum DSM 525 = ATCC 6013]
MIKNISVIDSKGYSIGETFFKRARQLVKKGRANWIGKNTIKLIVSNTYYEEVKSMSTENNKILNIDLLKDFIGKIIEENSVAEKAIDEISKLSNEDLKAAKILQVVESHDKAKVEIAQAFADKLSEKILVK